METTAFVEKARKRTMSKFQFVTCMVIICMLSGWLIGMAAWMAVLRYQRGPEPPQTLWGHADLPERAAAVVRERDAAYEDARMMQERLRRLIDAEPQKELADLRARLAAFADSLAKRETGFTDCRLAEHMQELCSCHDLANAIRDLLRKEAK